MIRRPPRSTLFPTRRSSDLVEDDCNLGPEVANGLQLEAGNLKQRDRFRCRLWNQGNCGSPDVPADQSLQTTSRKNFTGQGCGRGFPVRSGNRDDLALKEFRCKLNFPKDVLTQCPRLIDRLRIYGNTGTYYDQVLILKRPLTVAAGFNRYPVIEQRRYLFAKLVFRLRVGHGYASPARLQKERRSHARAPH